MTKILNDPNSFFHEAPIISEYSADQAVEDGLLVSASGIAPGRGHYITRAVWDDHVQELKSKNGTVLVSNITGIVKLWAQVAAVPVKDDWHIAELNGKTFWMIPNETGGLTLMYPEDY